MSPELVVKPTTPAARQRQGSHSPFMRRTQDAEDNTDDHDTDVPRPPEDLSASSRKVG